MTSTQALSIDPLAEAQVGDDDPIGGFDPDNVCGKEISTGVNAWNTAECTREPHPPHWVHINTCDDRVTEVWFDQLPFDPTRVRLSQDGLVCVGCAKEQTAHLDENHFAGCQYDNGPHYVDPS